MRRRVLSVLPLLAVAGAVMPGSAAAQEPSCTAEVTATQDRAVAAFSVDCGETTISSVRVSSERRGTIEENTGTGCTPDGEGTSFTCQPTSSGGLISARYRVAEGEVCADPALEMAFAVTTGTGGQPVDLNEAVTGCSGEAGAGGNAGGNAPVGGVDTGAGATAARQDPSALTPLLAFAGLLLGAVGLGRAARHRS